MGLISGISDVIAGRRAQNRLNEAAGVYEDAIRGAGPVPEYEGPAMIERAAPGMAQFSDPGAYQGPGAFMGAGAARAYAEGLTGGYSPVDYRDQAYGAVSERIADELNAIGGPRGGVQQRAMQDTARRTLAQAAPGIEAAYSQQAADLNARQMQAGLGAAQAQSAFRLGTAGQRADYELGRFGMENRLRDANAARTSQANIFNAGNQNVFAQNQADRMYGSEMDAYLQGLSNEAAIFNARTGNALAQNQLGRQIGGGVQSGFDSAAQIAMMGAGMPPLPVG